MFHFSKEEEHLSRTNLLYLDLYETWFEELKRSTTERTILWLRQTERVNTVKW